LVTKSNFYPVILAGGRGTRFWPLSRRRRAKQMLALAGKQTMIQQTVARLLPLAPPANFLVITNSHAQAGIARQLKRVKRRQIIAEPVGRNTAPAIGLAAFLLVRQDPKAILGLFPSDHVIDKEQEFRGVIQRAIAVASAGENMVVMGIQPHRPETGYGYIEAGRQESEGLLHVRRFTEKPSLERAKEFCAAGNYFWNSGMFIWSARTLVQAMREHLPETARYLEEIASTFGTRRFAAVFRRLYPKCENISVDYAILEPRSAQGEDRSRLYCIPSNFGWNDLGSWAALYEHHTQMGEGANVIQGNADFVLNAEGNYVYSPNKFVAAVGVRNLVVVETRDALLITTRERAQDVGKVVKYLDERKLKKLT